jgi:hypothetical protein
VRHKADQTRLPVHGKGPTNPDLNWLLVTPKLKRLKCLMWKSIMGTWLNVRSGFIKSDPTTSAEILWQPIFGNSSILSSRGTPLGVNDLREGCSFAQSGCTRIRDLWNLETREWKGLIDMGRTRHPSNKQCLDIITSNIPWRFDEHGCHIRVGDWIANPTPNSGNPLD